MQGRLEQLKYAGKILWFGFEAIKLRLADNTFYTPAISPSSRPTA
jgi:hypothetical protein